MLRTYLILSALVCGLLLLGACRKAPPANVAATVNNRVITYSDLDKQYAKQFAAEDKSTSPDLVAVQKLEVLRSLIDNEIMLQRAEKLGLMAVDSDVTAKFNELKAPYTQEEFQKQLATRKLTVEELRAQLRRDLSVQKLFNREITSHISISDKDVAEFYNQNRDSFNLAEPQIHMAQMLVTPRPDPSIRNLRSDKAQNEDQAKKKIQMLEARLKKGEEFAMLAQNYSEDPDSAPNGGDLGFIPESALEKANVELRKMVMQLQPGQISPVIRTPEGYRILKVISKEPAGQRDQNDPRVQQTIRETLLNREDTLFKAAYYEIARNESKVVNHYATSLVEKMRAAK
jgi:peptidyl-prolyl cis-trans isomerase SurA